MSGGPYHLPLTPLYNVFCHWKKHLTHDFAQTVQIPFSDLRQPPANQITYDFCKCIAHAIVGEWLLSLGEISCKQGYAQKNLLGFDLVASRYCSNLQCYSQMSANTCQLSNQFLGLLISVLSLLFVILFLFKFLLVSSLVLVFFHYSHMGGISQR